MNSATLVRRLGLAVIVVGALIFVTEATLARLRQRNIDVVVQVQDVQMSGGPATSAATPKATAEAQPSILTILPDAALQIRLHWDYRIGPTFPTTIVQVTVTDSAQQVVAEDSYRIDCGIATLQCGGTQILSLAYGVKDRQGTRTAWPIGSYMLHVTRTFVGLSPLSLSRQDFRVSDPAQAQ